jgi:excisionase family DNA binding protein
MPDLQEETTMPITATVRQFMKLSGIGRNKIFEMIKSGELPSVKIGGQRLVWVEAYREIIKQSVLVRIKPALDDIKDGG